MTWRMVTVVASALTVMTATLVRAGDAQPTGTVTGNLFVDQLYGYRFEKGDNWKFGKIEKEKPADRKRLRFSATQMNYTIPDNRRSNQENYTPPQIGLWVDTTSLSVEEFAAGLKSPKSKLKAYKDLSENFRLLTRGDFEKELRIQLDGINGYLLRFTYKYQVQIYNRANDPTDLVDESRLGDLYLVKDGHDIVVFFYTCERPSYLLVKEEVETALLKLKLKPETTGDSTSTTK